MPLGCMFGLVGGCCSCDAWATPLFGASTLGAIALGATTLGATTLCGCGCIRLDGMAPGPTLCGAPVAPPPVFAELKFIATVRGAAFFAGGASPVAGAFASGGRFGAFCITCVPGFFFVAGDGGAPER